MLFQPDHAVAQPLVEAACRERGGERQRGDADIAGVRLEMADKPGADAAALQLRLDEQRAQAVAAKRDRADDAPAPLAHKGVTLV